MYSMQLPYKNDSFLCNNVPDQQSAEFQTDIYTVPIIPDHDGGRPMEVNACILTTHMVYL